MAVRQGEPMVRRASPRSRSDTNGRLRGHGVTPAGMVELRDLDDVQATMATPGALLWIDLESPTSELLAELAGLLEIHPLIVEDIAELNNRSKVELTDELLHIVMFALSYDSEIRSVEVDIVLGARFLLTAHGADWDPFTAPLLRRGVGPYLATGTDYLLWAITDYLVDGYFPVFDQLGDAIEDLQDEVIRKPAPTVVERLFQIRVDLLKVRHAVAPQREIFNQLTNRDLELVKPERIVYFRDVYDHLIRLSDELDSFRELVSTTLEAYLSIVNNNLSDIMKRLTAVTVVLAGIGAVAGVFGMSEAGQALKFAEAPGFWLVTAIITLAGLGAFLFFRKIDWI